MITSKKITKSIALLLAFVLCFCSIVHVNTYTAHAATDNSTTLLSNVKNSARGEITFKFKVPAGYKGYYEILPSTTKVIHGSESVINTDFDKISGTRDNRKGTTSKTYTITAPVKLYGNYKVRVGLGGYYNGSSSVRQSKIVKSTMCADNRKIKWDWTAEYDDNYDYDKEIRVSKYLNTNLTFPSEFSFLIAGKTLGLFIGTVNSFVLDYTGKKIAINNLLDKLKVGEDFGYYLVENSDNTTITVYFATFYESGKVKPDKVKLKTLYHSNYVSIF